MNFRSASQLITNSLKLLPSNIIDEAFNKSPEDMEYMDQFPKDLTLCISRVPFNAKQFTILQSMLVELPHFKIEAHIIGESHCIQIDDGSRKPNWSFGEVLSCAPTFECDDYRRYELDEITQHNFDPPSSTDFLGYDIETNVVVGPMAKGISNSISASIRKMPLNIIHRFPIQDPHGPFDPITAFGVDIINHDLNSTEIQWRSLHAYPNVNGIVITKSKIRIG